MSHHVCDSCFPERNTHKHSHESLCKLSTIKCHRDIYISQIFFFYSYISADSRNFATEQGKSYLKLWGAEMGVH